MGYLVNSRQRAEEAKRRASQKSNREAESDLIPGVVTAANGGGYDVATIDESGNMGRTYERVWPHPIDQTFSVDDEVWLWVPGDGESPRIFAGGGGGGTCYASITAWGVLFS